MMAVWHQLKKQVQGFYLFSRIRGRMPPQNITQMEQKMVNGKLIYANGLLRQEIILLHLHSSAVSKQQAGFLLGLLIYRAKTWWLCIFCFTLKAIHCHWWALKTAGIFCFNGPYLHSDFQMRKEVKFLQDNLSQVGMNEAITYTMCLANCLSILRHLKK